MEFTCSKQVSPVALVKIWQLFVIAGNGVEPVVKHDMELCSTPLAILYAKGNDTPCSAAVRLITSDFDIPSTFYGNGGSMMIDHTGVFQQHRHTVSRVLPLRAQNLKLVPVRRPPSEILFSM